MSGTKSKTNDIPKSRGDVVLIKEEYEDCCGHAYNNKVPVVEVHDKVIAVGEYAKVPKFMEKGVKRD